MTIAPQPNFTHQLYLSIALGLFAGNEGYQPSAPSRSSDQNSENEAQTQNLSYAPLPAVEDDYQYNPIEEDELSAASHSPSISNPQIRAIEPSTGTESPTYDKLEATNPHGIIDATTHDKPTRKGHRGSPSTKSKTSAHYKLRRTRSTQQASPSLPHVSRNPPSPQPSTGPRASHNLVEKQYRNRLNSSFDTLLAAIPAAMVGEEVTGFGCQGKGLERRVSKAEVLVLAKKHIETLERERESMYWEREELKGNLERLMIAWISSGGKIVA
ncbi:Allergen [Lachnellula occidentalis]|uniref:Allergen n=1 Tax=Lachnellula occidentalis TaxID=215460 RepID=A0A8H8U9Y9_9HELO|nr:Allergen [Lachnellula occidentalis]